MSEPQSNFPGNTPGFPPVTPWSNPPQPAVVPNLFGHTTYASPPAHIRIEVGDPNGDIVIEVPQIGQDGGVEKAIELFKRIRRIVDGNDE